MLKKKKFKEELNYININKAKQNIDIITKIKQNCNIPGDYIFLNLNSCINTSYLNFDFGPLTLLSILFINIAIVI